MQIVATIMLNIEQSASSNPEVTITAFDFTASHILIISTAKFIYYINEFPSLVQNELFSAICHSTRVGFQLLRRLIILDHDLASA